MDATQSDHPTTEARANFTDLLAATRHRDRVYFLTTRGKRQGAVWAN